MKAVIRIFSMVMIVALSYLPAVALSNANDPHTVFTQLLTISGSDQPAIENLQSKFDGLINQLSEKQSRWGNDAGRVLEHMFYKVHRTHLKKYEQYQSFEALMDKGVYGCLTGTALYALILEELGYDFEIVETNYHIFIIVKADGHRYLIESTDPVNGFEDDEAEIDKRLAEAKKAQSKKSSQFVQNTIFRSIELSELVGLQYYNMAIASYNQQDFITSAVWLDRATAYYNSDRLRDLLVLVVAQIGQRANLYEQFNKEYRHLDILATL